MPGAVTIIRNVEDAGRFIENPQLGKVVCFTPESLIILKRAGVEAFFLVEEYANFGHGRAAVVQYKGYVTGKNELLQHYDDLAAESISAEYWWLAATYYRLVYSLRGYDNFNYFSGGKWRSTHTLDVAIGEIFILLQARKRKKEITATGLIALPLYWLHNYLLIRKLRGRKFVVITQNKRKLPRIAAGVGVEIVALDFNRIRLSRVINAMRSREFAYLAYPQIFMRRKKLGVKTLFNKSLEQNLADLNAYQRSYRRLLAQAAGVISDYISGSKIMPFCREARLKNIPVFMINHGSHVKQETRMGAMVDDVYATFGRVVSPYASYLILRNPLVYAQAQELANGQELVAANLSKVVKREGRNDKFTILHAGNFSAWDDHVPWVTETAEEFLLGVKDFADVVRGMDNCRLIIRVKGKKSYCNAGVIREFIGPADNIEVKDDAEFYADLAAADLLVASNSNTIHEALENKVPVLLYSYRNRYHHITPDEKVVFAAKNKQDLPGVLQRIIDLPADKNYAKYAWDDTVPGLDGLCKFIAARI